MKIQSLAHKKVAIYGYGREGQSILRAIRQQLPSQPLVILNDTDLVDTPDVPDKTEVYIGKAIAKQLKVMDVVIKSPGIPAYKPEILAAKAQGVAFTSATQLWFDEHPQAQVICVTGTKGKSTTSSLIAHLLRAKGVPVALGGNIGTPLFDLPEIPQSGYWVLELSSYQTHDLAIKPILNVLLNLFPEHLDWHGNIERYFRDKLHLLIQSPQTPALLNFTDPQTQDFMPTLQPQLKKIAYFNHNSGFYVKNGILNNKKQGLLSTTDWHLPGEHNLINLGAALSTLQQLGFEFNRDTLKTSLADFQPLAHRLRTLGQKAGRLYVDDSISTTPQSAQAAVQAFPDYAITLLLGGYDRGLEWHDAAHFFVARPVQRIITLPENGPRIAAAIHAAQQQNSNPKNDEPEVYAATDLADAIKQAKQHTPPGGLILLSPGSPSYGTFQDFKARGKAFAHYAGFEVIQ
ncbi:UDP-N-acetylmuramoyl-L-alanine--D-glutamate ligase [Candidatus Venteria ishoeyi]|uniref:UDP-N-acetylmuramoylalanine--D-glutamate ligase n=1 Tax=Candidatus Venteria ishoeyi TaxID=1899563 RepID=A0A1H6FEB9_9GAMM|nr:UDP-N-acetylmuramoyl-L-alanine--D-glutamate ligase [Candidatus Venteria ishoeyi]SEH08430.1 UDP-N-acetylmuramoylalanine--D-glutamate ligase [Candidatus Venteria ishoeyi]